MKKYGKILWMIFFLSFIGLAIAACSSGGGNDGPAEKTIIPLEPPTPTPVPRSIEGTTALADSVVKANDLTNKIQCAYDSVARNGFVIKNLNSEYDISFYGQEKGLTEIKTASGKTLIRGGMTAFVTDTEGNRWYSLYSGSSCRTNTNRLGYYYYEVNIRDLSWGTPTDKPKIVGDYKFGEVSGNMADAKSKNGKIECTVTNGADPYVVTQCGKDVSGVNAVQFDISCKGCSGTGEVFYSTSVTGGRITADTYVSFSFDPDGKPHTVTVVIPDLTDRSYLLNSLRFDINGASKGVKFVIENIKLCYVETPGTIPCGFEHTLHSYSDKIHSEIRILYDKKFDNLNTFGYEYKIPVSKVDAFSADGKSETKNGFEYAGFYIKDSGTVAFIIENDGVSKGEVSREGDYYVVSIFADIKGVHKPGTDFSFGHRIYTSEGNTLGELAEIAYTERNPLEATVTWQFDKDSKLKFAGYSTKSGAYDFTVAGIGFASAYQKRNNNKYYGGTIEFKADGHDREIYICSHGAIGCLEAAVILDENKMLVPLLPEVCKNFVGEYEESYYDPKDSEYGDTVYPLVIAKNTDQTHTMLNIYQKWGLNNLKQISSISFHIGYYHLSTGTTESNCIAPYFVYGRDGWTLPDFRGCSGKMWSSQPQFNSVGRLRFLSDDERYGEYLFSNIRSSGPVYADMDYAYISNDGNIAYTLRHVEFPSTDENRTFYTMTAKVLRDADYTDARNSFCVFDFDGRFVIMKKLSYKAENGSVTDVDIDITERSDKTIVKLAQEAPFVSLYDFAEDGTSDDGENFAYIVKDYDITVGGKKFTDGLILRYYVIEEGSSKLNKIEIGFDTDELHFKAGDTFKINFILLPNGLPRQKDDANVHYVIEDSVDNPWKIESVTKGTLIPDDYLAIVRAENDVAEFTVTGSRDCNAVRVDGFTKLVRPKIQELVNGEWVDYIYNVEEYDGYQVNYTYDGYFSYSFIVKMEKYTDHRTFRISAE